MHSNPVRSLYPIALAHLTIELCDNYLPVVYPILIATMGLSYAQVGLVTLIGSAGATLVQPLFGYLSDRLETRRIILSSIVWIGTVMGVVGLTRSYGLLVLLVGLGSIGSAAFHPAGASAAGSITTTRRGATLSVFSVSGTLGTALSPLLISAGISWLGLPGTTLMLTVLLISISIGTLLGGTLSDRIGRWQVLALSLGLLGPTQWFFMRAGGPAQVGFVVPVGVLIGASFPVTVVMAQESWPRGVGLASALVMGLGWLPGGIGASFTGLLADQTSLATALHWLVIPPVLGLACVLIYALIWARYRV